MNCRDCKTDKSENEFAWRNKAKGVKHKVCKECQRAYNKLAYKANPEPYKARAKKQNPVTRANNKLWLFDYLSEHPCVDCGETDIIVLEFDHREPLLKAGGRIHSFIGTSLKKLQEEIAKCDVVCCNCHAKRTAKYFGWERLDYVNSRVSMQTGEAERL